MTDSNNSYDYNQQSCKMQKSPPATTVYNNLPAAPNKVPINKPAKSLSENKLKRLNILTFINGKKEILFTKKASKFEKERIWRQIFQKMLEFGMVSAERDWRYVRDVSFSNWRKRAQKRLKHLSANGHRLNMDECEFLIYDILGQAPDKSTLVTTDSETASFAVVDNGCSVTNVDPVNGMDDESDEYMIDSDEDDDDDISYDEMLFIPKIVFNDNLQNCDKDEYDENISGTHQMQQTNSAAGTRQFNNNNNCKLTNEMIKMEQGKLVDQEGKVIAKNSSMLTNGNAQRTNQLYPKYHYPTAQQHQQAQQQNQLTNNNNNHVNSSANKLQLGNSDNVNGNGCEQVVDPNQSSQRYMNKFRELRLLDLEIENKILKNRFMKLQVFQLEQNLGLEHCDEVKELANDKPVAAKAVPQQFKLASGGGAKTGQFTVVKR